MALAPTWDVPMLHRLVFREFPVEPVAVDAARINDPQYRNTRAEAARFTVNYAVRHRQRHPRRGDPDRASTSACRSARC